MESLTTGCLATAAALIASAVSGTAGFGGALLHAIFLRLDLAPTAYVVTDAAAMDIVHAAKLAVFGTNQV